MSMKRRTVLKGLLATGASVAAVKAPYVQAQPAPIRIGFLLVKTGPLASGGLQMEQGFLTYLKDRNNTIAGRRVELTVSDTTGNPAVCRTKMQELVERFNVHVVLGPLAAFEALAIDDLIRQYRMPTLALAGAEDLTQRKANPWFTRPGATSAQPSHAIADFTFKDLGARRAATTADDFAFGHENVAGFQRVFEDLGGRVVQKLWPPLNAPDYGTYLSALKPNLDAFYIGQAGSNGLKIVRQIAEYGLKGKFKLVGGFTPIDESLIQQIGEDGMGAYTGNWYSAELEFPENKKFVELMNRDYKVDPGVYAATCYLFGEVLEAAVKAAGGNVEDKETFQKAIRGVKLTNSIRGPCHFDEFGNVVGNIYIRQVQKKGNKYVNAVIKTYPNVSQFWTYNKDEFLKNPVYSRDWPPARYLEK